MSVTALYEVPAPAKINLFLHVVGRRADGYHLLQSVFLLIDWADLLHFERRTDGRLARHDLGPALPEDDLCLRAARALQQASGCRLGADIHINKRVPWGAGLGGGSSDAASTLLALNRLWQLRWPRQRLAELALGLGADVPFFIGGQNAFVEGIGERLTPLPAGAVPPQWLAVVKPEQAVPTPAIFASPILARDTKPAILIDFLADTFSAKTVEGSATGMKLDYGRNDLQPPAEAHCPDIKAVGQWLLDRYGNSRMTGSGSAVFARVGGAVSAGTGGLPQAAGETDQLPPLPAQWTGRMCRSLVSHPLVHWAG